MMFIRMSWDVPGKEKNEGKQSVRNYHDIHGKLVLSPEVLNMASSHSVVQTFSFLKTKSTAWFLQCKVW